MQDAGIDDLELLERRMAAGELSNEEVRALFDAYTQLKLPEPPVGTTPMESLGYVLYVVPAEQARPLIPKIKIHYASGDYAQKNTFLILLSATESQAGAEAFVQCVTEHGWPEVVYPRVFWELPRLNGHADILYPDLLIDADEEVIFNLAELLNETDRRLVTPESLAPVVPLLRQRLPKCVARTQAFQDKPEDWGSEEYRDERRKTIAYLQLAARTNDVDSIGQLEAALNFKDPLILVEAVDACLQRDHPVPDDVIERIAGDHLTRAALFEALKRLERLERFPARWRTWDAFACAEMVQWLNYPTELGEPPAAIEKVKVIQETSGGEVLSLYIWRFREEPNGPWLVGISGPYELAGTPQPVHGHLTFSQFTRWDASTPEDHVGAIVEMFEEFAEENRE